MTDSQLMTLALAVLIPLSMLLYSNSRITEAKETLRAEIGESKQTLRGEIAELRADMRAGFDRIETALGTNAERLEAKLLIHELEHHRK
jgi:hypothetical protein